MSTGTKLLIIDDDPDLLKGLSVSLRASGFTIATAGDGVQALAAARRERPDLIVLDLGLPGGDGYMVLERIKRMHPLSAIPIVVLSARDPATHREKALAMGADLYFQKPADSEALIAAIRQLITRSAQTGNG